MSVELTAAKLFELKEEEDVEKEFKVQLKEDGEFKDIEVQSNFSFDSSSDSTTSNSDSEEVTADAANSTADNDDEEEGEINSADDGEEETIGQEEEEEGVALGPLKTKNELERLVSRVIYQHLIAAHGSI